MFACFPHWSSDTSLVKKERHANVWSLTQRHQSTSLNKEWKDKLVRLESKFSKRDKRACSERHFLINFFCHLTVITGSHKSAVSSALTRVEVLVDSFRRKQPFTHFLSFPLNDPKIQEGFLQFKDEVLQKCAEVYYTYITQSIMRNVW